MWPTSPSSKSASNSRSCHRSAARADVLAGVVPAAAPRGRSGCRVSCRTTAPSSRCQPKSSPNAGLRRSTHTSTTLDGATAAPRISMKPPPGRSTLLTTRAPSICELEIRERIAEDIDLPCVRVPRLGHVQPPIGHKRHEVSQHDIRQMRMLERLRLIARQRQPDERKIRRAPGDLDVAIPELALIIVEYVVRRNIDAASRVGLAIRDAQDRDGKWPGRLIRFLGRRKARRKPFAVGSGVVRASGKLARFRRDARPRMG